MWRIARGRKIEIALKALKSEYHGQYLKNYLDIIGQYCFLQSRSLVRYYGIALAANDISLVMEYFKLGPLDVYLRENEKSMNMIDLVEAANNLASALWHLKENNIVHGKIRCRKLMVSKHETNSFAVKLIDPGLNTNYTAADIPWLPPECHHEYETAKHSTAADVYAMATTFYEIFTFGSSVPLLTFNSAMDHINGTKRLAQPSICPDDIYTLMKECWHKDSQIRKRPQEISRDINQLLYQVYNKERQHTYCGIVPLMKSNDLSDVELITDCEMDFDSSDSDNSFTNASFQPDYNCTSKSTISDSGVEISRSSESERSNYLSQQQLSNSVQNIFELDAQYDVVLHGRIGVGNYGEVYKGTLESVQNNGKASGGCSNDDAYSLNQAILQVAVKKMKQPSVSCSLDDMEREIAIMKALKHPNIVQILGVVRDPYILLVMEYVNHGCLQSYLQFNKQSVNVSQLLKYAADIATGMDYLGQKNIVHRDLAARNILVVDRNNVKISDFGLAQFMESDYYRLKNIYRELPIKWYAPESVSHGKFYKKSDVWSYGVTLYEMFSLGEDPPLLGVSEMKSDLQVQEDFLKAIICGIRLPRPSLCPQSVYTDIMFPCWQYDPDDRPTFKKLLDDIISCTDYIN